MVDLPAVLAVAAAAFVSAGCATTPNGSTTAGPFVIPVASNVRAVVIDMGSLHRTATGVRATVHALFPNAQPGVGDERYDELRSVMEFDCARHRFRTLSASMHLAGVGLRDAKAGAQAAWESVDQDQRESVRTEAALCQPPARERLQAPTLAEARRIYEERLQNAGGPVPAP